MRMYGEGPVGDRRPFALPGAICGMLCAPTSVW